MLFDEIIGHSFQKKNLAAMLENDRMPHAMLFEGEEGTGKLLLAKAVAAQLTNGDANRVTIIKKNEGKKNISIDQLREIRREANLTGFSQGRRVFIVDDADRMTVEAANCFLKLLEEPPDGVHFILVTCLAGRLPETILSRLVHMKFYGFTTAELKSVLKKNNTPVAAAELAATLADGDTALAQALLRQGTECADKIQGWLRRIESGWYSAVYEVSEAWQSANSSDRDSALIMFKVMRQIVRQKARAVSAAMLVDSSAVFDRAERAWAGNANFRLTCEKFLIELQSVYDKYGLITG